MKAKQHHERLVSGDGCLGLLLAQPPVTVRVAAVEHPARALDQRCAWRGVCSGVALPQQEGCVVLLCALQLCLESLDPGHELVRRLRRTLAVLVTLIDGWQRLALDAAVTE